jgi:hypothetical protein
MSNVFMADVKEIIDMDNKTKREKYDLIEEKLNEVLADI